MIITVVTPTLNGAAYLRECIASVKRNHHPSYAVDHVIVDAGSTDGTVEIARENGLRIIQGKDQGIFDAINKGSFNSDGDLLGFLGADDIMLDGALTEIASLYRASRPGWIVGGIRWIGERGEDLGSLAAPPHWMTPRIHACLGWNPIMHMSTYFSRELFMALGGFNIAYKDAGDYELFARALLRQPYGRIDKPLTCFRRTRVNNSVVNAERASAEARAVLKTFGPESALERALWRQVLKAWFNLRNPRWLAVKASTTVRLRLRLDPALPNYF